MQKSRKTGKQQLASAASIRFQFWLIRLDGHKKLTFFFLHNLEKTWVDSITDQVFCETERQQIYQDLVAFSLWPKSETNKRKFVVSFTAQQVFGGRSQQPIQAEGENRTGSPDCDGETFHPATLQGSPPIFSAGSVSGSEYQVFCL